MKTTLNTIQIHIDGISYINCCNKIEKTLNNTDGIISVKVSYETALADITYDTKLITENDISAIISKIGYRAIVPIITVALLIL